MKKIFFLLLFITGFLQAQTLQNPTYGNTTTNTLKIKTPATVTSVNFLSTNEADGSVSKIAPINVTIPYTPVNYTISNQSIGQHLTGIDAKLGALGTTSAGITQRVYFTADNTTVNSVVYFASSVTGKGTIATGSPPALVLGDNTKGYFTKDLISIAQPSSTIGYAGTYGGNLTVSATPTPVATQQRFTVEIYRTNNLGVPISSGVSGAPTGDLGVTVLAILDSGIINLSAGSITNVPVSGILTQNVTINTGERLRYHVSAAKIGTGGGNVTFGVYYGSSYNSYYDVPVAITTDAVINKSVVSGVTDTDALNTLNTLKENLSNKAIDFSTVNNTLYPTVQAVKVYTDGLVVGLLDDRGSYNASSNLFPTTGGSGSSGTILKGDIWYVSVAGTLGGKTVNIGDSFRALTDSPGQNTSNWALLSSNLSYVPENSANKSDSYTASSSTTYSSTKALVDGLSTKQSNLTNPITGTGLGLNSQVAFFTGANSVAGNNGLRWDNTNKQLMVNASSAGIKDILSLTNSNNQVGVMDGIRVYFRDFLLESFSTYGSPDGKLLLGTTSSTFLTLLQNGNLGLGKNPTEALDVAGSIKSDVLSGTGTRTVVADASGKLSATDVAPISGTYTSTLTNTTNITSSTFNYATYIKVGDVVTVTVSALVNVTTTNTLSKLTISLPVNRTPTTAYEVGSGVGFQSGLGAQFFPVFCQMATNTSQADLWFRPTNSGNHTVTGTFSYKVN